VSVTWPAHGHQNYDDELQSYVNSVAGVYAIATSSSVGASSLTLNRSLPTGLDSSQIVAIDLFTTNCELKTITSVSGTTLSLSSTLRFAHSAGAQVYFLTSREALTSWFGAKGDNSTDDHAALLHGTTECSRESVWLEGLNKTYRITAPLTPTGAALLRNISLEKHASYAPVSARNAMLMYGTSRFEFTATASNNTFTTTSAHDAFTNYGVVFYGSSLPGGITKGEYYFAIQVNSTQFKVATTVGGAEVDLTSDGSGEVRTQLFESGGRMLLDNVRIDGGSATGMNGILMNGTQPGYWRKVYVENCPGWGIRLRGQDYKFENTVILRCGRGLVMDGMGFTDWFGLNIESLDVVGTDKVGIDFTADDGLYTATGSSLCHRFYGLHFENCKGAAIRMTRGDALFDGIVFNTDEPTAPLMRCNGGITNTRYRIRHTFSFTTSDAQVAIDDSARGWTGADALLMNADFARRIDDFIAPNDFSPYASRPASMWAGIGKGYHRVGGSAIDYPMIEDRIPSGQTADFWKILNSSAVEKLAITSAGELQLADGPRLIPGTGSPEGVVTAPVGSLYLRSDGGAGTTLYVKQSGTGSTGWAAK
jgi:hypothetical protein